MAWRFGNYHFVKEGILDNTKSGKITGEIEFADLGQVVLDLGGDMQGALLGKRIRFDNPKYDPDYIFDHGAGIISDAKKYMCDFTSRQNGAVGDIRVEPYLYIEWYSETNDRCVIELPKDSCTLE